jgi:IS1 family transposase
MSTTNNINKRIQNTTQNIARNQNKSISEMTLRDKLQPYTKGFMDLIKGKKQTSQNNNSNINNNSKNKNIKTTSSPFDNPIILMFLVVVALFFIGYGLYKFMDT